VVALDEEDDDVGDPIDPGSNVAGTRTVSSSSPRTTLTPSASIFSTSGRATSRSTVSTPPLAKRAPKMLPIAPAPTTATLIGRPSYKSICPV